MPSWWLVQRRVRLEFLMSRDNCFALITYAIITHNIPRLCLPRVTPNTREHALQLDLLVSRNFETQSADRRKTHNHIQRASNSALN